MPRTYTIVCVTIPVTGRGWSASVASEETDRGLTITTSIQGYGDILDIKDNPDYTVADGAPLIDWSASGADPWGMLHILPKSSDTVPEGWIGRDTYTSIGLMIGKHRELIPLQPQFLDLGARRTDYVNHKDYAKMCSKFGATVSILSEALAALGA